MARILVQLCPALGIGALLFPSQEFSGDKGERMTLPRDELAAGLDVDDPQIDAGHNATNAATFAAYGARTNLEGRPQGKAVVIKSPTLEGGAGLLCLGGLIGQPKLCGFR